MIATSSISTQARFSHCLKQCTTSRSFASTARVQSLVGTAPHHTSYVLLHTHRPPKDYPPKSKSPLLRALMRRTLPWGGLVNFSWSESQVVHPGYAGLGEEGQEGEGEAYRATAFSRAAGRLDVSEVSLANVDTVAEELRAHALGSDHGSPSASAVDPGKLHLYVCTHGQRDCRCGDSGGEVSEALRKEVQKRGMAEDIMLGEVAHVGGHKYAANLLIYPYGEWLGTLQAVDVPMVLDEILERHAAGWSVSADSPPLCPPFWRGRMGLNKEEQLALHSRRS